MRGDPGLDSALDGAARASALEPAARRAACRRSPSGQTARWRAAAGQGAGRRAAVGRRPAAGEGPTAAHGAGATAQASTGDVVVDLALSDELLEASERNRGIASAESAD